MLTIWNCTTLLYLLKRNKELALDYFATTPSFARDAKFVKSISWIQVSSILGSFLLIEIDESQLAALLTVASLFLDMAAHSRNHLLFGDSPLLLPVSFASEMNMCEQWSVIIFLFTVSVQDKLKRNYGRQIKISGIRKLCPTIKRGGTRGGISVRARGEWNKL